jgi:hypothetical protein
MTETHLYGVFLKLWEENGVQLSTQYAGAASSKSKYTRKEQTTVGFLSGVFDAAKTTTQRLYANTFLDTARQLAMDAVLGKGVDPNAAKRDAAYNAELRKRIDQFSSVTDRYVMVATWNVNGQEPSNEDITPWLLPNTSASAPAPDVYVIGFQEIVDLTAQNVLYVTDQTNSFAWERHIQKVVTERTADGYVLIKTRQLVGVLLMVYVRKAIVGDVRSLGVNMVKLGYGGMTGNKGAIGVRLELGATSLCFVCAHLAAGQKNVDERNQNWNDAQQTLKFGRRNQWSVDSHDLSIWLGDFNYRIDVEREDVIDAVKKGDYKPLIAADQLQQERAAGRAFTGYHEGRDHVRADLQVRRRHRHLRHQREGALAGLHRPRALQGRHRRARRRAAARLQPRRAQGVRPPAGARALSRRRALRRRAQEARGQRGSAPRDHERLGRCEHGARRSRHRRVGPGARHWRLGWRRRQLAALPARSTR